MSADRAIHRPSGRVVTVLDWPEGRGVVKVEFEPSIFKGRTRRVAWVPQADLDRLDSHR